MFDAMKTTREIGESVALASRRASEIFGFPIDMDSLVARSMGSLSFATNLLSEFGRSGNGLMETLRRQIVSGDTRGVAETAHSLKGVAAIIAAEDLQNLAAAIETAARAGGGNRLPALAGELGAEMQRCLGFVATFLDAFGEA